jgi:hypothetical protein
LELWKTGAAPITIRCDGRAGLRAAREKHHTSTATFGTEIKPFNIVRSFRTMGQWAGKQKKKWGAARYQTMPLMWRFLFESSTTYWSRVFIAQPVGFYASCSRRRCTHPTGLWSVGTGGATYCLESGFHTMMQRPKREYVARATTLFGTVVVHTLIIYVLLTNARTVFTSTLTQPTIMVLSEPRRRPVDWNLPPVKLTPTVTAGNVAA